MEGITLRPISSRPCYKLSVELLATYKHINELFYEQKRKKTQIQDKKQPYNNGFDDADGNYIVQPGEEIANRYTVQECLGKGSFGVVVKAHDSKRNEDVAVKIIKNKIQFFHQAKVEIEILTHLNNKASEEHNIVKLKKVFSWKDHLCLVFELMSFNLYDLLKYTKFNGVSLNLIRKFAVQLLKTMEFLCSKNVNVIHCDLKPENILLKNPKRSGIKVIDFGSSCFTSKKMFKYIQSRFYRSPEVILGLPYDTAIDMWSLGCILVEMHTGQPIFDGKDEGEQILKFASILGAPSQRLIEQCTTKRKQFFQWDAKQKRWTLLPPKDPSRFSKATLESIIGVTTGGPGGRRRGQPGHSEADYTDFLDLVKKIFVYNSANRLTPTEALQHPFLAPVMGEAVTSPTSLNTTRLASPGRTPSSPYTSTSTAQLDGQHTAQHRESAIVETSTRSREPTTAEHRSRSRDRISTAEARSRSRDTVSVSSGPTLSYSLANGNRERRDSRSHILQGTISAGGVDHRSADSTQVLHSARERRASLTSGVSQGTTAYQNSGVSIHSGHHPVSNRSGSSSPRRVHSSPSRTLTSVSSPQTRRSGYQGTYLPPSSPSVNHGHPRNGSPSREPHMQRLQEQQQRQVEQLYMLHQSSSMSPTQPSSLRLKPKQPGGTAQAEGVVPASVPRPFGTALPTGGGTPSSKSVPSTFNKSYSFTTPDSKYSMSADTRKWISSPSDLDNSFRKFSVNENSATGEPVTSPSPTFASSSVTVANKQFAILDKIDLLERMYLSPDKLASPSSPPAVDGTVWGKYGMNEATNYPRERLHNGGAAPMVHNI